MKGKPIGDLCVTMEPTTRKWAVVVCTGEGVHRPICWCATRAEAQTAAEAEQAKRVRATGSPVRIVYPEQCPCFCNFAPGL